MGLNIDNLFVRESPARVAEAFDVLIAVPKWKIAVSDTIDGWAQVIDSHGKTPPELAAKLSGALRARVVCAQVYEGSGDAGLHVFDDGQLVESWMDDEADDPSVIVQQAIERLGILVPLLTFRETVKRSGWQMVTKK
jgi:hypothetical protein